MYDAVIVGARCAGSSTAMLLAQKGYRVLLVDRANFPSDTLSSHQIQIRGGAALKRWGLLEQVLATGSPSVHQVQFDAGYVRFQGQFPPLEGVDGIVSPRRIVLDKILVDRAVAAGVELREDLVVDGLIFENDRVTGIHGRTKAGRAGVEAGVVEKARIVIGADGKHSLVAKEARALEYHVKPALTCAYYTYWEGLDLSMGRLFVLPRSSLGIWPTHQSLSMVYTAYPIAEFQAVRSDIAGRFWKTIEAVPGLADELRAGKQAERFYGTADLPAFYRRPYG
ncbi:MAG TPA: FAD-dependent monooxygenase, partial [Anaerolineales bacterium]